MHYWKCQRYPTLAALLLAQNKKQLASGGLAWLQHLWSWIIFSLQCSKPHLYLSNTTEKNFPIWKIRLIWPYKLHQNKPTIFFIPSAFASARSSWVVGVLTFSISFIVEPTTITLAPDVNLISSNVFVSSFTRPSIQKNLYDSEDSHRISTHN